MSRFLRLHFPTGGLRLLREDQDLELPELLPGFKVPVSRFFAGI